MFDVVLGLPVHALVVHAVVVLLPLMSVVTVLVAVRPGWRGSLRWVAVANLLVFVMAFVAVQSGEALQNRLSTPGATKIAASHGDAGKLLIPLALLLLLATLALVVVLRRSPKLAPLTIGVTVVVAVAALSWTVVVGHSGAVAVWKDKIAATNSR